jgi:16S rRNA (adenine1518-N6/adenine1519-N6)-dimethyltransferase
MKIHAKKSLGQHFLKDENIAKKIVSGFLEKNSCKIVLEIGPGQGVLTKYLLNESSIELYAVEIDSRMAELLLNQFPRLQGRFFQEDFLTFDLNQIAPGCISIIGNFPYNISSQILFKVLQYKDKVPSLVGMFQKEVARRITVSSGNKDYGILSVLVQAFYHTEYLFEVGEKCFVPPPKVKSAVIRLSRKDTPHGLENEELFFKLVKAGFGKRRKTLRNSLKEWLKDSALANSTVVERRAEQLTVKEWIDLANAIGT